MAENLVSMWSFVTFQKKKNGRKGAIISNKADRYILPAVYGLVIKSLIVKE